MVVLMVVRGRIDLHTVLHHMAVKQDEQTHKRQVVRRFKSNHMSATVKKEQDLSGQPNLGFEIVSQSLLVFVGRVHLYQDL